MKDHGFGWGYTWTRGTFQWMGVVAKAPRKGAHRRKRERRPLPGMRLHQDGSRHAWPKARRARPDRDHGPCDGGDLCVPGGGGGHGLDLPGAEGGVGQHGLPMSLYTDRGAHYFHTPKAGGEIDRGHPTQVGRGSSNWGRAHRGLFAAGEGRSERAFETLQDRPVKDSRLPK